MAEVPDRRRGPRLAAGRARALGLPTRGTTSPNRLRRIDRWIVGTLATKLRGVPVPLVVDLGYGSSPITTIEFHARLALIRPDIEIVGLEIDRERVATAAVAARPPGLRFTCGGFELAGMRPALVRAMNVLRQYEATAIGPAWDSMLRRIAPGGILIEGTCDEIGRRACWFAVERPSAWPPPAIRTCASPLETRGLQPPGARSDDRRTPIGLLDGRFPRSVGLAGTGGPASPVPGWSAAVTPAMTLSMAAHLPSLSRPSELAERLPKALIACNVPGEDVYTLLSAFDDAWMRMAPRAVFGPRQRWVAAVETLRADGWPVQGDRRRWRLGELTVTWPPAYVSTDHGV